MEMVFMSLFKAIFIKEPSLTIKKMDMESKNLEMVINIKAFIIKVFLMDKVFVFFMIGKYKWVNGSSYKGDFHKGHLEGKGVWKSG
jgi:hypothetical protein